MSITATAKDGRDGELRNLENRLKRTIRLCKVLWEYRDVVDEIKQAIASEDLPYACGLWNDLDYEVQKYLNIAPKFGGAFTTKEREIIKNFWHVTVEDIENDSNTNNRQAS